MEEKVFFENSKGDKLCGILSDPGSKIIVVMCHGFASGKDSNTNKRLQKELNDKGIATFRFDFYGHEESEGDFENITISEAIDDTLKAIELYEKDNQSPS